jgi:hypothetical protein
MQQERLNNIRQDSLLKSSHKYKMLIIMTHGHPWQNLDQSSSYLSQPHKMDGPLTCLIFTGLSSMVNLIQIKKCSWNNLRATKSQMENSTSASCSNHFMDSNRQAENGTMLSAKHLQIFASNNLKLIQPSSMLTRTAASPYLHVMCTIV